MILEYPLTYDDFTAAQKLHMRQKVGRLLWCSAWIWGIPVAGALLALLDAWEYFRGNRPLYLELLPSGVLGLCFAILLPLNRWYCLRKAYKAILPPAATSRVINLNVSDDAVVSSVPGVSEGKFFWKAILDFVEGDAIALLYVRKKCFLMIPRRSIEPQSYLQMREIILRNLKTEARG